MKWQQIGNRKSASQNNICKAFDQLVEQMARVEGVTEELKAMDQMEWVKRMNNVRMRAEEIVREQIVYIL
jgi:hypothetical protein